MTLRGGTWGAALLPFVVAACASAPDGNARVAIVAPSETSFPSVATFLERRCGTLDCHGQVGRNLRLYGFDGLRLDPTDVPGGRATTADEIQARGIDVGLWRHESPDTPDEDLALVVSRTGRVGRASTRRPCSGAPRR